MIRMDDYRDKLCVLDGEYVAKCIGQDFFSRKLTFEVEPDGATFVRYGDYNVEIYEKEELELNDVKHLLPRIYR
jgi:hypothetical protein